MRTPILASLLALTAAACESPEQGASSASAVDDATSSTAGTPSVDVVEPAAEDGTAAADPSLAAPQLTQEAEKGEEGARNVLLAWGSALEAKDFAKAYAQFRDPQFSLVDYRERFADYRNIAVAMPTGRMEGAAGSSYYTAPTTVSGTTGDGTPYELKGDVVLRRVNDVPGATEEQLHWKIESAELAPA